MHKCVIDKNDIADYFRSIAIQKIDLIVKNEKIFRLTLSNHYYLLF